MSWAMGFAGLGKGMAELGNKYIDEEMAQNRAKYLADLQLAKEREREEFIQSPEVQGRRNENAKTGVLMEAAARRQAETDGANDAGYQWAQDVKARRETQRRVEGENAFLEGTTGARVTAANALEGGTRAEKLRTLTDETKIRTDGQMRAAYAQHARQAAADPMAKWSKEDQAQLKFLETQLGKIDDQIIKAKATGGDQGWNPKTNPQQAELEDRFSRLQMERKAIIQRYQGSGGISDPLGVRGSPPATANPEAQKPAAAAPGQSALPLLMEKARKKAAPGPDDNIPEAKAVDAAREAYERARRELYGTGKGDGWGAARAAKDPQGARAAREALAAAEKERDRAEAAWAAYARAN